MVLDFVVSDARKRGIKRVQEAMFSGKYVSPHKGKIIGDDYPTPSAARVQIEGETSQASPDAPVEKFPELNWQKCRHRVPAGEKSLCRKFTSGCAQERCPKKNIDM